MVNCCHFSLFKRRLRPLWVKSNWGTSQSNIAEKCRFIFWALYIKVLLYFWLHSFHWDFSTPKNFWNHGIRNFWLYSNWAKTRRLRRNNIEIYIQLCVSKITHHFELNARWVARNIPKPNSHSTNIPRHRGLTVAAGTIATNLRFFFLPQLAALGFVQPMKSLGFASNAWKNVPNILSQMVVLFMVIHHGTK